MKRVFLYREGAFGDHLHMSNVIKAFHEDGWEVTFLYNLKGAQIHTKNPRIAHHQVFESSGAYFTPEKAKKLQKKLAKASQEYDRFVSFQKSLEDALIANEATAEYFWPLKKRRAKNTKRCYYDQSMLWAGLAEERYMGWTGEVFFDSAEHEFIKAWLRKYVGDKYFILWAMRGTMYQKAVYPLAEELCTMWLKHHPNTVIVTTGDKFCQQWEWDDDRVVHKSGRMPFRQALHLARYADLVVTPETGLGIGAGCFATPKIMLLTAASLTNIVGNDENDYSMQSPAWCSPCTRAIYNTANCPPGRSVYHVRMGENEVVEEPLPLCVDFEIEEVFERMREAFETHGYYNKEARNSGLRDEPVYMM
jgi:ADP-heptose:LPS heptosyltransferase